MRAALRRVTRNPDRLPELELGAITVNLVARTTRSPRGDIHLTPLEYRVLECLARHANLIVTHAQLLREAWGPDRVEDSRSLRVCLKNLRQKLEPNPSMPRFLLTEVGLGYRLCVNDAVIDEEPAA